MSKNPTQSRRILRTTVIKLIVSSVGLGKKLLHFNVLIVELNEVE